MSSSFCGSVGFGVRIGVPMLILRTTTRISSGRFEVGFGVRVSILVTTTRISSGHRRYSEIARRSSSSDDRIGPKRRKTRSFSDGRPPSDHDCFFSNHCLNTPLSDGFSLTISPHMNYTIFLK
ncbi:hypothetical protein AB6A40_007430 [Gnathostoma spinigerum]|uniref:Uncharacterized protein n=1 Tax=Gnathostoma spinigerum TaxID=75299 RepID=A0ABD6ELR3_9BILA